MLKQISLLILLVWSAVVASAQTVNYNAPVKWERYKVDEREVSVLFPKLPVVIQNADVCKDEEVSKHAAYADGVVYGLNIINKIGRKYSNGSCGLKANFSWQNFENRLKEIKSQLKTTDETNLNLNGVETVKVKGNLFTYWLINDFNNKRWFELWITEEKENVPSVKNFVESFKIEKNPQGIEIRNGSGRTLGDEAAANQIASDAKETNDAKTENEENTPLRLIFKPYPSYTEAAREKQVKGTVRLRVTFSSSGGISDITPLNELSEGLTEQAVAAASKIVFIPAKKNGVSYTLTKIVEYSFSIH